LVRGEPVKVIQRALWGRGFDPRTIDGIFGADTEGALKGWQGSRNEEVTGQVTFAAWQVLTGAPALTLRERALQLTADFEQHGFSKIAGNFDGAWLTWGIIGFTLKHGEMQRILSEVHLKHSGLLRDAFGPLEVELLSAINGSSAEQEAFANRISVGRHRFKVAPDWAEAFAALGEFPDVQAIQLRGVDRYWEIATRDMERFQLDTELGAALCFDIAVQNGGIDFQTEETSIERRLAQNPPEDEKARRTLIADVVAENSNPQWVEDVRSRKRTIAIGEGAVHGATYKLDEWGLIDVAAQDG
jgi:hypothetical protein